MGVTNRTPWNTHRETDEPELERLLEYLADKVQNKSTAVFCIHCPPHGTKIDEGPVLDKDLRVQMGMGGQALTSVGSTAVRKFIEKYQPLLGLHGHIHESTGSVKLGKTLCVNPGSEYTEGILRGALVTISGGKVKSFQLTRG
jgi:Icc-related predicted phosphoesterase